MSEFLLRVFKAYFHLTVLICLISGAVLFGGLILSLVKSEFSSEVFGVQNMLLQLKLLAALTVSIPAVILCVFGLFAGIFKVFKIEVKTSK